MWMAEIAERAILSAMSDISVTFRASRVNDEPLGDTERKTYPCMVIKAGGGTQHGDRNIFYDVPVEVTLVTLYTQDPKRTTLASLEDEFRQILDAGIVNEFDAIASAANSNSRLSGVVDISGGPAERVDNEQYIATTMVFKVCGRGDAS